jgi:hypothetical protein
MKRMSFALSLAASLMFSSVATAAPLSGLKFEQQKQQIVKDVRKIALPAARWMIRSLLTACWNQRKIRPPYKARRGRWIKTTAPLIRRPLAAFSAQRPSTGRGGVAISGSE